MKNSLFFITLLFLVSCTSNTIYKAPKDLIPKDTMELLLYDLNLVNSSKHKKNIKLQKINYMPLVYEKYKIDSTRFKESNIYYISTIDTYETIFEAIKLRLKAEKEKYATIKKEKDSIRKDSLRKWKKTIKKNFKLKKGIKKLDKLGKGEVFE